MLETEEAVENAKAWPPSTASTPCCSNQRPHDRNGDPWADGASPRREALRNGGGRVQKHGKFLGMGGIYDPAVMKDYVAMGARLILAGNDFPFLMKAAKEQADIVRGMG